MPCREGFRLRNQAVRPAKLKNSKIRTNRGWCGAGWPGGTEGGVETARLPK